MRRVYHAAVRERTVRRAELAGCHTALHRAECERQVLVRLRHAQPKAPRVSADDVHTHRIRKINRRRIQGTRERGAQRHLAVVCLPRIAG